MFAYSKMCSTERSLARLVGLKKPEMATYHRSWWGVRFMFRRWVIMLGLVALGLALSGCSKCGPFWEDWMSPSKSCRSDHL
jgi:hypothetical protein